MWNLLKSIIISSNSSIKSIKPKLWNRLSETVQELPLYIAVRSSVHDPEETCENGRIKLLLRWKNKVIITCEQEFPMKERDEIEIKGDVMVNSYVLTWLSHGI